MIQLPRPIPILDSEDETDIEVVQLTIENTPTMAKVESTDVPVECDQQEAVPEPAEEVIPKSAEVAEPSILVNLNLDLRWLRDHPLELAIGDVSEGVKIKSVRHHEVIFACFISQLEPKTVEDALSDSNWIETMQDELN